LEAEQNRRNYERVKFVVVASYFVVEQGYGFGVDMQVVYNLGSFEGKVLDNFVVYVGGNESEES
jgi:hypothetical protein